MTGFWDFQVSLEAPEEFRVLRTRLSPGQIGILGKSWIFLWFSEKFQGFKPGWASLLGRLRCPFAFCVSHCVRNWEAWIPARAHFCALHALARILRAGGTGISGIFRFSGRESQPRLRFDFSNLRRGWETWPSVRWF